MKKRVISIYIIMAFVILNVNSVRAEKFNFEKDVSNNSYKNQRENDYENDYGNDDMRACWISFLDMEKYLQDLSEDAFREKLIEMYQNIIDNGMDTVIVQVRAMGDTIYPSDYFGFGYYISSNGKHPGYDPLKIMIEKAEEMNLRFEAWMNPYRLSRNEETTEIYKNTTYYEQYKNFTIEYINTNGEVCLSLAPEQSESLDIIKGIIDELVNDYNIKHFHFDDYFYVPGLDNTKTEREKMDIVNSMVSSVYSHIHSYGDDFTFGISPEGNTTSARMQGADIDTWLSVDGYVDYIMPQIYWSNHYEIDGEIHELYSERCVEWQSLNKKDIPIYVGLALYRSGEESSNDFGWSENDNNLSVQYQYAYESGYDGFSLFRYEWLENNVAKNELLNLNSFLENLRIEKTPEEYINIDSVTQIPLSQDFTIQNRYDGYVFYSGLASENRWKINVSQNNKLIDENNIGFSIFKINLGKLYSASNDNHVLYRCKLSNGTWTIWSQDGEMIGDLTRESYIEKIQIKIDGELTDDYQIAYRVLDNKATWSRWYFDGEIASNKVDDALIGLEVRVIPSELIQKISKNTCISVLKCYNN